MLMNSTPKYLINTWYAAALSSEVKRGSLFSRKILNTSTLIYRCSNGEPVAMRDRCPHRFAPLSAGKLNNDEVTCIYHGLKFSSKGDCIANPHGNGRTPSTTRVRTFPIVERDGFLWLWPGDPEKADESLIMNCGLLSNNPSSSVSFAYMHNEANYELLADNIMDLSHIDHLHGPLINTGGKLSPLIPEVTKEEDGVRIRWDWLAEPAMLMLAEHLTESTAPAKQFFDVKWQAPSNLFLQVGALQDGEDFYNDGIVSYAYHVMTPETNVSSHYFYASTRNYKMDDDRYNRDKLQNMIETFSTEDKPIIEAQQKEMGTSDLWEQKPALLSCDVGAVQVRRTLRAIIDAEQGDMAVFK
jgi:phenylpropionate dioxygenase-like ring-hydroxylating dioxygenase large terminal subunit